ncbi:hypothetical protein EPI10_021840 [Gossypium australe]|uniref:Uncharacterized protein n=1 Tax=Gossypium australe TaxID=47621 RepID=A0A5B6WKA1_9ROSI|nr:hypothetical protein EPI10_021840 [Gossypium australe]
MDIVKFDDPSGPNVAGNTLPSHSDKRANMIIESGEKKTKMNVVELKTPLKWVWKKIVKTRKDEELLALVQNLMDNKELKLFEYAKGSEGKDVCASEEGSTKKVYKVNHPVVIISRPRSNEAGVKITPKVIIQKPVAFLYEDNKRVP